MPSSTSKLSLREARRVALAAQGFTYRPLAKEPRAAFRGVVDTLGFIQLDPLNVLCRMHYLTVYGRIGSYDRAVLDRFAWDEKHRELFEYWGPMALLLPTKYHALFRWRMENPDRCIWGENSKKGLQSLQPGFVDNILKRIAEEGPMSLREIDPATRHAGYDWSAARVAIEWLFRTGQIAVHSRRNFTRVYDIAERVIPLAELQRATPGRKDAQRELIRIAACKLGVATSADLRNFWALDPQEAKARVGELIDSGELMPVVVQEWKQPGLMWHMASPTPDIEASTLLSPFDLLLKGRNRTQRLFDFDYKIEFYVPKSKRVYGYFVLPQLVDDKFVSRVDLRYDRESNKLLVLAANPSGSDSDLEQTSIKLADNLTKLADWLGAERLAVPASGRLGGLLRKRLREVVSAC